jgi:DNA-binding XRE family transcriptional regulator
MSAIYPLELINRSKKWTNGSANLQMLACISERGYPDTVPHKMIEVNSSFLKRWRMSHELTQAEVARMLTVSKRTYEGWEAGRPICHPQMLALALKSLTADLQRQK